MSRRFAFALVAVVLVQFCSVYAWQRYERNAELQEITDGLAVTNGMAITGQEKLFAMEIASYEELMRDDTKIKFSPMLRFVTDHYAAYEELAEIEDVWTLQENASRLIESIINDYKAVMLTHHNSMYLHEDDVAIKYTAIGKLRDDALSKLSNVPQNLQHTLKRDMVRLITLDFVQNTLIDVMAICSGRSFIFDQFFPVFNADRCAYKVGDSLNARVSVGSYSNALDPENVTLTIDGKEYPIGPDGAASFQTSERKRGQHTVKTKVVVTNPLTGEVKSGEGRFTYEVY